jgi:transposase-like protein
MLFSVMKVIQDNRPEARFHFPMHLICTSCKSELEVESSSEIKTKPAVRFVPSYTFVECPLCKAENSVKPHPIVTAADYYAK